MTDLIDARTLWFITACQEGRCDCCNGYCHTDDLDPAENGMWDVPLVAGTINGIDYYGNGYTLVRRDRIDPDTIPDTQAVNIPDIMDWMTIPDVMPELDTNPVIVRLFDIQARCGLDRRTHMDRYVHLYQDGDHVGWSTIAVNPSIPGTVIITPDQYPEVRRISRLTDLDISTVAKVLNAT